MARILLSMRWGRFLEIIFVRDRGHVGSRESHERAPLDIVALGALDLVQHAESQEPRKRDAERAARMQAEVEAWFEQFDQDKDGKLSRDELRALLTHLHPSRPPSELNLDYLIERATAIESATMRISGNKDGKVGWHDVRQTVLWYSDYCKDQRYIDSMFAKFDVDD